MNQEAKINRERSELLFQLVNTLISANCGIDCNQASEIACRLIREYFEPMDLLAAATGREAVMRQQEALRRHQETRGELRDHISELKRLVTWYEKHTEPDRKRIDFLERHGFPGRFVKQSAGRWWDHEGTRDYGPTLRSLIDSAIQERKEKNHDT